MAKYGPRPRSLEERFWEKVEKTDGCWYWRAKTNGKKGYGMFMTVSPNVSLAHRVSWELANGIVPPGLNVLHECDTPLCVRPDHLFLGTQAENMKDKQSKGRGTYVAHHGSKNGFSILNEEKVSEIRLRHSVGESKEDLAKSYGVGVSNVRHIISRRAWKHVN